MALNPLELLEQKLMKQVARASMEFAMLEPDDRVMVCVSGGKDSWVMLHLLRLTQRIVPFRFSMIAVNLDQHHPGFPAERIREYLEAEGYEHRMLSQDTYSIVLEKTPPGKAYCAVCSRMRRGVLYNAAEDLGATKMALGHHRDDVLQTALLNLFHAGKIAAMPAKLRSDDGRNTVIRPLVYCAEDDLAEYATAKGFPVIPCNLCGSQENLQRQRIKTLIGDLEREYPHLRNSMFAALGNVEVSQLLDRDLQRRVGLDERIGLPGAGGRPAPRSQGLAEGRLADGE